MKISFCLIVKNEASNLPRCLRSLAGLADEIVVVDSGSTDDTESIAKSFGVRWHYRDWPGFGAQKNAAIDLALNPWIFSIDADEEISPPLREEILELKKQPPAGDCAGFSVPRCVLYEGRWIRHGDWYPDRLVRLFRREQARFTESKVHERLEIRGRVIALAGDLNHYTYTDAADHERRCRYYARLWAEAQHEAKRTANPAAPYLHAAFRWLRGYILRLGFLDGRQGWRIASFCAWETYLKYKLLRD